jgi:hypothetical protein
MRIWSVRRDSRATIWATQAGWRRAISPGRWDILLGQRRVRPYVARHRFARRLSVPSGRQRQRQGDLTPCHFQRIAGWGACGKTRVVLQNRRPDQERTKTWGHDVRVLLSAYGGRGDEPLVALAVRLRALGVEVRVCAPPDWAERPADSSEGRQRELRTCPTPGSTELEAPVIRSASAVQQSTAASEVSR